MKQRPPKTRQGGSVLDLINKPPQTTDTKSHNPGVNNQCRTPAALCAHCIATTVAAPTTAGIAAGISPPNSTVNATNPDHNNDAFNRNERTQPRAVVCGTSTADATPLTPQSPRTPLRTSPIDAATSRRPITRNDGKRTCETRQPEQRPRASHNRQQRPATRTDRSYLDQKTIGTKHAGHATRGTTTERPAKTYDSTETGHGHTIATG
jgi:hypothetical protein